VRSTAALRGRAASASGRVWVSRRLPFVAHSCAVCFCVCRRVGWRSLWCGRGGGGGRGGVCLCVCVCVLSRSADGVRRRSVRARSGCRRPRRRRSSCGAGSRRPSSSTRSSKTS
jgi:hypothetical protein